MLNHTSGTHPMAYIECINTKTDSRTYFAMTKPIISIGSKSGNDILLNKGDIGTHHARIVKRGDAFTIQLLDMKRPFFVNGRSFRSCPLKFDDKIDLSFYTLHLRDGAIPNDDTERQKDLKTLQELVAFSAALIKSFESLNQKLPIIISSFLGLFEMTSFSFISRTMSESMSTLQ